MLDINRFTVNTITIVITAVQSKNKNNEMNSRFTDEVKNFPL